MAKSIIARRQGDEYQARVFWLYALQLLTNDYVESVIFESDQVSFMDDLVVKYNPQIVEPLTGEKIDCRYFQCKYHVVYNGAFTYKNLIDPKFINSKESILQRMFKAYQFLAKENKKILLHVYSNWNWHPDDDLSEYLHEELIRDKFFEASSKSKIGKIRKNIQNHLGVSESDLQRFLKNVRFTLGNNLTDLSRELSSHLRLAGLKQIDLNSSQFIYDDLAWKYFQQGRNTFDRQSFEQMVIEEGLIDRSSMEGDEISIRSFAQFARRPKNVQTAQLDITKFFNGRTILDTSFWNTSIPQALKEFLLGDNIHQLKQPINLFFDCHLSIAFMAGQLINPKYGIRIVPIQKSSINGFEIWKQAKKMDTQLWNVEQNGLIKEQVVVCISVTNPVKKHVLPYLSENGLNEFARIELEPKSGIGPQSVADGDYAWQLGYDLRQVLRKILPTDCHTVHLFMSLPVALAYILGDNLRSIAPNIQLYEHDFEGQNGKQRYSKSININSINY